MNSAYRLEFHQPGNLRRAKHLKLWQKSINIERKRQQKPYIFITEKGRRKKKKKVNSTQQSKVQVSGIYSQNSDNVSCSPQGRPGKGEKCRKVIYRQICPSVGKARGSSEVECDYSGITRILLAGSHWRPWRGKEERQRIRRRPEAIQRKGGIPRLDRKCKGHERVHRNEQWWRKELSALTTLVDGLER